MNKSGNRQGTSQSASPDGKGPSFSLLPDPQPRWKAFGISVSAQLGGLLFLLWLPLFVPYRLPDKHYAVIPLAFETVPLDPPNLPPPKPKLSRADPKVNETSQPARFAALTAPRLTARPRKIEAPPPQVLVAFQPPPGPQMAPPPRPRPDVQTGVLRSATAPLPQLDRPLAQVQTGGYGSPLGQAGEAQDSRANVARLGSYDLPAGPGVGNGTGGAQGARGVVPDAGFGKTLASGTGQRSGTPGGKAGQVRTGGFADVRPTGEDPKKIAAPPEPPLEPVEILSKPNPVYTEEARRQRREGEVLLQVVFAASGDLRVVRVLQGLGYGLDEAAVRAAKQIRFRPAQRQGSPVDTTATLHIVFELAY